MTKEDVKNLNLALEKLNEINNSNIEKWAKRTGLEPDYILYRLLPYLINRRCIIERQIGSNNIFEYRINSIGKEYLLENKFKKEYRKEIRNNMGYYLHWFFTALAIGLSVYSITIN